MYVGGFCKSPVVMPSSRAMFLSLLPCVVLQELRRAINSRNRDGLRILGEIQQLGDKIDNLVSER